MPMEPRPSVGVEPLVRRTDKNRRLPEVVAVRYEHPRAVLPRGELAEFVRQTDKNRRLPEVVAVQFEHPGAVPPRGELAEFVRQTEPIPVVAPGPLVL